MKANHIKIYKLITIFRHMETMQIFFGSRHNKSIVKNSAELAYEVDDIIKFQSLFEVNIYETIEQRSGIFKLKKLENR